MKKVGILTFHRASNYGAVLQAFALQQVLDEWGCDAQIVDYRCPAIEKAHDPKYLFKQLSFPKALWRYVPKKKKYQSFEEFRTRRMKLSEPVDANEICMLDGKYDLFLVGSDQVWSDRFAGLDPVYRLDFAKESSRYSYACSLGFDSFPDESKPLFKESLQRLDVVSVREASASALVMDELGIEPRVDVDPTLLLSADKWRSIAVKPQAMGNYILLYTVQPPSQLIDAAKDLSKKTGIPIVYLNNERRGHPDLRHVRYSSPEEFLGWFDNASFVFTNSFHGTAFSIIFEKDFWSECTTKKAYNRRSSDLLKLTGLESRELTCPAVKAEQIDWEHVQHCLYSYKKKSIDYLRTLCFESNE